MCEAHGARLFSPVDAGEAGWVAAAAARLLPGGAPDSPPASDGTGLALAMQVGLRLGANGVSLNPSGDAVRTGSFAAHDWMGTWLPEAVRAAAGALAAAAPPSDLCAQLLSASGELRLNASCDAQLPFVCKRVAGLPATAPAARRAALLAAAAATGTTDAFVAGAPPLPPLAPLLPLAALGGGPSALLGFVPPPGEGVSWEAGEALCGHVGGVAAPLRSAADWEALNLLLVSLADCWLPMHDDAGRGSPRGERVHAWSRAAAGCRRQCRMLSSAAALVAGVSSPGASGPAAAPPPPARLPRRRARPCAPLPGGFTSGPARQPSARGRRAGLPQRAGWQRSGGAARGGLGGRRAGRADGG